VSVITKRETVTRDIDLLSELARHDAAAGSLSCTSPGPRHHCPR
jgi:DNA repair photolyase